MIYLSNINLNKNELQNAVLQPLAIPPSNPVAYQIYTDSTSGKIKQYISNEWKTVGVVVAESSTNGNITVDGVEMTVYELPKATASTLGGIRIGTGLSIDAETGIVSVSNEGMAVGSADKLTNARTIELTGDVTGSTTFDGSQNVSITATVADDSHNHIISNVDGLQDALDDKVDAVTGKGLSTNDYTTTEKNKLAGIADGAEVNVNADWDAVSGDAQILNKPTALSDFTNDEGFIDNTVNNLANYYLKTETYTQSEVNTLIGNLATIQISSVSTLPATGSSNTIYLVPKSGGTGTNVKDEYLWTGSAFEKIGDTEIDLSSYLTKTGDGKDVTVTFTTAASRANIATGEKLSVIMGKLAKAFADLSTVAFSGSYNDLSNKPATIQNATLTVSTSQTSNSTTLTGTKILSVTVVDSVTHDVVFCDIDINDMTVTVATSVAPTNALNATIAYM